MTGVVPCWSGSSRAVLASQARAGETRLDVFLGYPVNLPCEKERVERHGRPGEIRVVSLSPLPIKPVRADLDGEGDVRGPARLS